MKLTCTCGASIEVRSVIEDQNTTPRGEVPSLQQFEMKHQPCLERWRAEIHRRSDTLAELERRHAIMREFVNGAMKDWWNCPKCGRVAQGPGCAVCGIPATVAPDPYARFRDATREGNRVFCELQFPDKLMMAAIGSKEPDLFDVRGLFIEGVDIPPPPTQEWLDKSGLELVGCRLPKRDERFAGVKPYERDEIGISSIDQRPDLCVDGFSGRRWIVKRKQQDDGFEKWYEENKLSLAFEANPRYSHTVLKRTWTAAQKAKT